MLLTAFSALVLHSASSVKMDTLSTMESVEIDALKEHSLIAKPINAFLVILHAEPVRLIPADAPPATLDSGIS